MKIQLATILLFFSMAFGHLVAFAQPKSDLKINPMFGDAPQPTLTYERIYGERTSWEVGLMLNRGTTCTYVDPKDLHCYATGHYTYLGGYAAWRWYPLAKPGAARWIFLGAAIAYGGGISVPGDVKSFFLKYADDPRLVERHNQRKLVLGPLGGLKLMEGRRISIEGLFCISPYYRKTISNYPIRVHGILAFSVNYRIYHSN